MGEFRAALRAEAYDLVLDTQGLLKSALVTRMARGRRCGYSAASAREPVASRFYDATFEVPKGLHAVERNRRLAALAVGYSVRMEPSYGIAVPPAPSHMEMPLRMTLERPHAVLLTATSRDDKLWPEDRWTSVGGALHERGLTCLLPAGSETERMRAARLAGAIPGALALPPLGLDELALHLGSARIVIGVDTGLVHLAAAFGRPTVALFCASDPALTGVLAGTSAVNLGTRGLAPSVGAVLAAIAMLL
jgi:heptosyltransferase-1